MSVGDHDPTRDDPLGPLAESFLARLRRGERPSVSEIAACHPALSRRIRDLFPAIAAMERIAPAGAEGAILPDRLTAGTLPARFGRYDLLQEIGRGGMGVVYQAWDRDAQRVVALKVVAPEVLEDARFRVESRVLARLEHESVIPLYEVGEHAGVRFFTMRFVEGGDLAGRLKEFVVPRGATRLEADEAGRRIAALLAKVARAVGYVHRRGVLHRDLKPGNILLGPDGQPLVSDFGLSRRFAADALVISLAEADFSDPESRPGQVVGSLGYMAPEQAEGRHDLTTAADIYSLGAILYKLLAGELPFATGTPAGLAALLDPLREPLPPAAVNPSLAPGTDLERVCLTCLSKDPAARYATADALADDLERVARGEPIRRADGGWPGRVLRILRRRRRSADDHLWGEVELIEAALNFALHAGLLGLIRIGAAAVACWGWFLALQAATWWVFLTRLFRGRRTDAAERDLLVLWVGISLAEVTLFTLYCPPTGPAGSSRLLEIYPPWAVVTGLGIFLAGRIRWGGLYLIGLGFLLLALLMPLALEFAPLIYGVFIALGLVWMGRVHARSAGQTPSTRPS